ncbi:MAG: glutathione peroxidase [Phaeodactylibacter sp.]|nr:glutathione peroxidase [Phaeodactylibacter sp.]
MKIAILFIVLATLGITLVSASKRKAAATRSIPGSFHELTVNGIDGKEMRMSEFQGKYVLCVNVASKCGFTPQYKGLQALYEKYQDKLVIIGFPCNQFLMQEPGSEEEIASFCEVNFGVTFPLTEKIKVKGGGQHPVFAWLTQKELNGVADAKVSWNFNKFLISPEGEWLAHFPSKVEPMSEEVVSRLQ